MKEAFWIYLFMILGVFTIVVMLLINDLTSTSEEDFYLAKEVLEASMVDAIDLGVYRETGDIRIVESKFVESFVRRFAESVNDSKEYTIKFYEIYEMPPKATVFISTKSRSFKVSIDEQSTYDILTSLSGILETKWGVADDLILPVGSSTAPRNIDYNVRIVCNGCKNGTTTKTVKSDGSIAFTIEAASGYVLDDSTIEGEGCYLANSKTVVVTGEEGNRTCTITLKEEAKPVINQSSNNGVCPSGTQAYMTTQGSSQTYCCNPIQFEEASSEANQKYSDIISQCSTCTPNYTAIYESIIGGICPKLS